MNLSKINFTYNRRGNPETRDEATIQNDKDQNADDEVYTMASLKVNSEGEESASTEDPEEPWNLDNNALFTRDLETLTVNDVLESIGFGKFHLKITLLIGITWTADAMEMMNLSILGPYLQCEWRLASYQVALVSSGVFLGMGISSAVWGILFDKYGRRVGLRICMVWLMYFGLLSSFAPVYGWFLFLAGLVGVGLGGAPQSVTLYSEFLPVKARGKAILLFSLFWTFGGMFEVLLAMWITPTLGWRWLLGLSSTPTAVCIICSYWLPESPRCDIMMGNTVKAMATLKNIAKENGKRMPEGRIVAQKLDERGHIKELFTPHYRCTTLLLGFIWFACSLLYYGIVLLATELFHSGDSCRLTHAAQGEQICSLQCKTLTSDDYKSILWTNAAEIPGLISMVIIFDRFGRKKSLVLCFLMFSLFIIPLYICMGRAALTAVIFIARAFIFVGFQVAFVYTPEVFPTQTRAVALGMCSAMAKLGSLITPFVSQVMVGVSMYMAFTIYCGSSLLAAIACMKLPFETSGRVLPESNHDKEVSSEGKSNLRD